MESKTLVSVVPASESALTVTLASDGVSTSYTVGRALWQALGEPSVGSLISLGTAQKIARHSERREAYCLALRFLESGDLNGKGLAMRLSRKGVSQDAAAFAVKRMRELGYINERKQAERYAAVMSRRSLWGERRIVRELVARGYTPEDAACGVAAAVAAGEIDLAKTRAALTARLVRRGYAGERLLSALYRYGYGQDEE